MARIEKENKANSPEINFIKESTSFGIQKERKTSYKKILLYVGVFVIVLGFVFNNSIASSSESIIYQTFQKINPFNHRFSFGSLTSDENKEDEIKNFLILGIGGYGHDGPLLTDTIIIARLNISQKKVSLVSIPRDLQVPIPGYGWRKANHVYPFAEMDDSEKGGEQTKQFFSNLFNIQINNYVTIDFDGVVKAIDDLGGLNIYVENSFVDTQYPAPDNAFQTVSFEQGWHQMSGEQVLKYARSRHGNNGENSDFSRSRRQQIVLSALQDKLQSFTFWLSPKKLTRIYDNIKNNVDTDLAISEMIDYAKVAKDVEKENIKYLVLDTSEDGPLYSDIINEAYVLLPKDSTFGELQSLVNSGFESETQITEETIPPAVVEIQNGTHIEGLAFNTSLSLKRSGFEIKQIGNAAEQDLSNTLVYDLTNGSRNQDLTKLKEKLTINKIISLPPWSLEQLAQTNPDIFLSGPEGIDFVIILGQDQNETSLSKR